MGNRNIIEVLPGISGPAGPAGPEGPPGPEGPVPAAYPGDQVTLQGLPYTNVQELAEALLYVAPQISNFSVPVTVYELGTTVNTLSFSWNLNKAVTSQTIQGSNLPLVTLSPADRTYVANSLGLTTGGTFTLTAGDGQNTDQANRTINFYNGIYFGDAELPGSINSAFIKTLNKSLQGNRSRNWVSNNTGQQYMWHCWPTRMGVAAFNVNGFDGGFETPIAVSFTNDSGYTENYYVARSTNFGTGPGLNIVVS
jgi:hypothetical protein